MLIMPGRTAHKPLFIEWVIDVNFALENDHSAETRARLYQGHSHVRNLGIESDQPITDVWIILQTD